MSKKTSRNNSNMNLLNLPTIEQVDETKDILIKKQWFIQANQEIVLKKYSFANKIGEGAFGCVYKATLIGTDLVRAIKVIKKSKVAEPGRLATQINLMKLLDHPNLVKLYETYETDSQIYLVMEYCEGGELFQRIQVNGKLTQKQAQDVFRDIAKAINYLHSCNVCHRDLKPENFLFLDKKPDSILKLTDFGLSTQVSNVTNNRLKSMVGTVYYISPQVLESEYDISCDVWSLGVILIVLLTGSAPFQGSKDEQIIRNVMKKNFLMPKNISATAKNLISRCLMPANKRIKASQILEHPWLIDKQRRATISKKMDVSILKKFSEANRLKKLVLTVIASQVKSKDIEDLAKLFKSLDVNSDGSLSRDQIMNGLRKTSKYKQSQLTKIIDGIDTDKNGSISYTQFLACMMNQDIYLKQKYLRIAFDLLDKDKNGSIQFEELRELITNQQTKPLNLLQWKNMIKEIDVNGDGTISFDQFVDLLSK